MTSRPILLIDRGDPPALAAAATLHDHSRVILWHLREPDAAASARLRVVQAHGRLLGVKRVLVAEPGDFGLPELVPPPGLVQAAILINATAAALELGCGLVVWPHQVGPDADAVGAVLEQTGAVGALVESSLGESAVAIDLPVVDYDDRQVIELAHDTGLPLQHLWPCETGRDVPCGVCDSCLRWKAAFEAADADWPWIPQRAG